METLTIHSKFHDYNVILHDKISFLLTNYLDSNLRYMVLIDEKLVGKYQKVISKTIPNSFFYPLEGSENTKTLEVYEKVINTLLELNFSKNDYLIAFGGGTVGDLTGYVASTYKRGINLINIPTTTLSMIDSSIGGKTAINMGSIKNSVGTIYPPKQVLIGFDVLETLPKKDFNNGLYEALKTGLIADKVLYALFKNNSFDIKDIVLRSLKAKQRIVEIDEDETGLRRILNFGHTFGHALELNVPGLLSHGEAVANGMLIVSKNKYFYTDLVNIITKMGCTILRDFPEGFIENIHNDKKVIADNIYLVEVEEIGSANIRKTNFEELKGILEAYVI